MPINKSKLIIEGENRSAVNAIKGVSKELSNAQRDVKGFAGGIGNALSSATNLLGNLPFMMAGIGTAAAAGFGKLISDSIDSADNLSKVSARLGVTTEWLSTMSYAAELNAVSQEKLNMSLQRFIRRAGEAAQGTGEAQAALKSLDIQLNDNNGNMRSAEDLLYDVADSLSQVENQSDRVRLAFKLFDSEGVAMLNMLQNGSKGMKELQEQARELGLEISTETGIRAENFNDTMLEMQATLEGIAIDVLPFFLEQFIEFKYFMENFTLENFIKSASLEGWIEVRAELALYKAEFQEHLDQKKEQRAAQKLTNEEARKTAAELQKEINLVKRLEDDWIKTEAALSNDVAKNSMSALSYEFFKIDEKVEQLYAKFGQHEEIGAWADSMRAALSGFDELGPAKTEVETEVPEELYPVEQLQGWVDANLEANAQITAGEAAYLALREGHMEDTFGNMGNAMLTFANLSQNTNKTLFGIYKAFSMAEAGVATYNAATKALATVPYPFNFAAAAAVTAAGVANIARIASMQPGGGAASGGAPSAPPQLPRTNSGDRGSVTNNNSAQVTIYVQGLVAGNMDQIARDLTPYIEKAIGDGVGSIQIGNG